MSARLATVLIFLFCGTMTVLLVRSVLYPEESRLATVAPHVPFDLFVARTEGSHLDIRDGQRIIGNCAVVPHSANSGPRVKEEKVAVRLEMLLQLGRTILGSNLIDVSGEIVVHSDGSVDGFDLGISLANSQPSFQLSIKQPPDQKWPDLKLSKDGAVVFESSAGKLLEGTDGIIAGGMLQALGIPTDALSGKHPESDTPSTVRAGDFPAGGQSFDGFVLTSGADEETKFRLYLSNTGEILKIKTPLGLEMLAESLRPAGDVAPKFERYPLPRRNP